MTTDADWFAEDRRRKVRVRRDAAGGYVAVVDHERNRDRRARLGRVAYPLPMPDVPDGLGRRRALVVAGNLLLSHFRRSFDPPAAAARFVTDDGAPVSARCAAVLQKAFEHLMTTGEKVWATPPKTPPAAFPGYRTARALGAIDPRILFSDGPDGLVWAICWTQAPPPEAPEVVPIAHQVFGRVV